MGLELGLGVGLGVGVGVGFGLGVGFGAACVSCELRATSNLSVSSSWLKLSVPACCLRERRRLKSKAACLPLVLTSLHQCLYRVAKEAFTSAYVLSQIRSSSFFTCRTLIVETMVALG